MWLSCTDHWVSYGHGACLWTHINLRAECVRMYTLLRMVFLQMTVAEFGDVRPPITADGPKNVTGELDLTQSLAGVKQDASADSRGLKPSPMGAPNFANLSHVTVAAPGRVSPGVKVHLDHAEL